MPSSKHGTASVSTRQMMEFGAAVLRQLPRDITPKQAQWWIEHQRELKTALCTILDPTNGQSTATCHVSVNYAQTLEDMIKVGKYDRTDSHIVQGNFPHDQSRGVEELEIELIKYTRPMKTDDVISDMESRDLRPATLEELCALGAMFPEFQRTYTIFALGSPWVFPDGVRGVLLLGTSGQERYLSIGWWSHSGDEFYRFAAVRK